ncbi:molybdopterin-dependent oxidoreductase [Tranquillimonas alkanivorans]|uniref:CO or xanthine dehydrogenase, Mo-binding subunit n=1 Tax=Tranquillimonas alkanivorans TaxID=441119 RepID=A0A1I5RUK5_9RHOB|nr:molybdopterin-dependent oxidoreductase [Tranquillimonas alkanivorans]SFP61951.1 CO or xanthine dehydrogenase, Mo-binding subunit [Tranquillimonas alkanivorans]
MRTTINGEFFEFEPDAAETAVDVIRERAGLTGTKVACGQGVCGSCAVLVDGEPINACLMPAIHMEGRDIRTVEAHGRDELHPVQLALMANEGLQCGFCTPGFVMEGIAFHDRWRAERGRERPTRDEIAAAMAGHLCRCAAYLGIYAAIADACEGEFDGVNQRLGPRVDALEKVTGEARYTVDLALPGQLEGRILRAAHANARVLSVDTSAAEALDGVVAVADLLEDHRQVRFTGQPVFGVAAVDWATAERALKLIEVDYEVLPAAIGMDQALAESAAKAFVGDRKTMASAAEQAPLPTRWDGNVGHARINGTSWRPGTARRRVAAARGGSGGALAEGAFRNHQQTHAALEPHAAVAAWEGGRLTVHASTQNVHHLRTLLADKFGLEKQDVQVESQHIGGGFGGKQGLYGETVAAVKLARAAGAPVRVVASRLEDLSYTGQRSGSRNEGAVVLGEDGAPRALRLHADGDAGIAKGTAAALLYGLISPWVAKDLKDRVVVNNTPPALPMRGPDAPSALWTMEQLLDDAGTQLGLDPVEVRRRFMPKNDIRDRLLDWAEALPAWRDRDANRGDERFRRGVGMAAASWVFLYNPNVEVTVSCDSDGLTVACSTQDIGNGTRTSIAKAVEDAIGLDRHAVRLDLGRADAPLGPVTGGSQVTASVYPPTYRAAERLAARLVEQAAERLNLREARAGRGGIAHAGGVMPWEEVLRACEPVSVTEKRVTERGPLGLRLNMSMDPDSPFPGFRRSHALVVTEVEVDTRLGRIRPLNVWTGIAAGRILVPELARSQVFSGAIQGMGYALYEKKVYEPATGHVLSSNLNDYRLPGIGDAPEVHAHFDEAGYEDVAHGAIGMSELATVGVAASVGNAVHHATGWRPHETPILPQAVVEGVSI